MDKKELEKLEGYYPEGKDMLSENIDQSLNLDPLQKEKDAKAKLNQEVLMLEAKKKALNKNLRPSLDQLQKVAKERELKELQGELAEHLSELESKKKSEKYLELINSGNSYTDSTGKIIYGVPG